MLALQPAVVIPVTVYVVEVVGEAFTVSKVVPFKPNEGVHVYVLAPVATKEVLVPEQIVAAELTPIVGGSAVVNVATESAKPAGLTTRITPSTTSAGAVTVIEVADCAVMVPGKVTPALPLNNTDVTTSKLVPVIVTTEPPLEQR